MKLFHNSTFPQSDGHVTESYVSDHIDMELMLSHLTVAIRLLDKIPPLLPVFAGISFCKEYFLEIPNSSD